MADELDAVRTLAERLGEARPSDRRLGDEIAADADIAIGAEGEDVVVAIGATPASGGRTVRFRGQGVDVTWSCTCTRDASPWCKHVVAAVLRVSKKAAARAC